MQAVIMAGGEGSRLRPLTSNMPKPMLPVANRPLMEHIIELLRRHELTDIVATVQFLSSVVRNYFGDGSDLGVSLSYATEDVPLGTAGSVLGAQDLLGGGFLVISGDALTDVDLGEVIRWHQAKGAAGTLVLKRMKDPLEFGIVMTRETGEIERFLEKPTWGQVFSDTVNTGIYVLEAEVLDLIPPDQPYDFSSELFPAMLDKGLPLFGYVTDAYWTDVGNTDAYLQAHQDVLSRSVDVELPGFELAPQVWAGVDVDIHPSARITGPALIGDNSRIGAGAIIEQGSVIGPNSIVGPDATISRAILLDGAHVGGYSRVRGGIVGRAAVVDRGATVEEGAVLGDEVVVGAGALVKQGVKIYPSRTVEAGAIVAHSVVRERRASRSLFGARGVSGLVNIAVTPTVAVRLGMAYGSTLPRGSVVVTGRDASRAARTVKRAVIAGLNATGVTCHDLELTPMPLTRFTVRSEQAAGGVSVRTSTLDPEVVEIRLFDAEGIDISESAQRKIDRMYFREDYRRPGPAKLGELEFPPRALEQYAAGLLSALDVPAIRGASPKVVIDYAFGPASLIGPSLLGRLGCEVLGLHGFVDEHRPVQVADDLQRLLDELCQHVRNSGSDVGVLLEPGGEIARIVDGEGRVVTHEQALLAFLRHEAGRGVGRLAVPVSSSQACEQIAADEGATLQWTATGLPALMSCASQDDVGFAGNSEGALVFSEFMAAPDALMTFGKTLELVARAQKPLAAVLDGLPATHVARRDVRTPWEAKGAVMRLVAETVPPGRWTVDGGEPQPSGQSLLLLDGVKVLGDDCWALVIPHPDEPLCRVWAEGRSRAASEELADRYAALIADAVGDAG